MADSSVTIAGSLGADPVLRFTDNGKAVADGVVAVANRYQKNGEWQEDTAWVEFTVWGDLAEHFAQCCTKGTRVVVTGRLKQESWVDKETRKNRSKLALVADEVAVSLKWATVQIERVERETAGG